MNKAILFIVILIFSSLNISCSEKEKKSQQSNFKNKNVIENVTERIELYKPEILRQIPHDINAFTQGLMIYEGNILESTGQRGESSIRKVDIETGKIIQQHDLSSQYFGEGITIYDKQLFFLTWTSQICFVFDTETFEELNTFRYFTQGWGLTNDETYLIMSDGSSYIRFLNPESFDIIRTLNVTANGKPVEFLNELEYVNGKIYANIWGKDFIYIINPFSGKVEGKIDLTELRELGANNPNAEVLNGIAYNQENNTFIVTGKNWDYYFEIKLKKTK